MKKNIESIQLYGEKAIIVSWAPVISEEISREVLLVKSVLEKRYSDLILDSTVGYQSLLVCFKAKVSITFCEEIEALISEENQSKEIGEKKLWTIPVCYDFDYGIDLIVFLEQKKLSLETLIEMHTAPTYHVYAKGFLPGFLYLGGLVEDLHHPRKSVPNTRIPQNAVAIGGQQTGIYPSSSPGGWHIIGQTPVTFFDVNCNPPSFISVGDKLQFQSITKDEFLNFDISNWYEKQK